MGCRRKGEPPRLNRHKSTGLGYVTINGKRQYLGRHGTPECRRAYRAVLQQWEADTKPRAVRKTLYLSKGSTVKQLVAAFMKEVAEPKYQVDGKPTSTYVSCRLYLERGLAGQFGDLLADDFRHEEFEEFRQVFLDRGAARNSMKIITGRILVLFRWGHRKGAVSAETLTSLRASPEPDEGEEREPIEPVPPEHLTAVVENLLHSESRSVLRLTEHKQSRRKVAAMVQIQELVGMRPGELCRMRGCEINRQGQVQIGSRTVQVLGADGLPYRGWIFQPSRHKNKKKGKFVAYLIGPKARAILSPWLSEDDAAYVWQGYREDQCYAYHSYRSAVYYACDRAGVPRFGVNRLRHSCASRYDRIAGIQRASEVLGHASIDTTKIYAERTLSNITGIVEKYG